MRIVKKISLLHKHIQGLKRKGETIGFVPTMGCLHQGHLSLVTTAKKENDRVVVSIFVNPTQFSPQEDFQKYPRDLKRDARLLKGLCDILFVPSSKEMYPQGFCSFVEVRGLSDELCGASRKGHFVGVTTVVAKLLNIIPADNVYFGRKDIQQAAIIKRMIQDLSYFTKIKILPIVRETDGLAMSSRNRYLCERERQQALVLFQALKAAERMAAGGSREVSKIKGALKDFISRHDCARVDYIEIVDKVTFLPLKRVEKEGLLLLAVFIGSTRLIDNTILKAA